MVIIDIGACEGEYVEYCLKEYDVTKIYAYEPHPKNLKTLVKKYSNHKKVSIHPVAVSNFNSMGENLYGNPRKHRYAFSLKKDKQNIEEDHSVLVPVVDVSKVVSDVLLDNDVIDLMKIDTEGTEYDILESLIDGNLMNKITKIVFEDHTRRVPSLEGRRGQVCQRLINEGITNKVFVEQGKPRNYVRFA